LALAILCQYTIVMGAIVEEVLVPTHVLGFPVWSAIRGDAACVMLLEMNGAGIGYEGLYELARSRPAERPSYRPIPA
jgi:hypothetical protein